MGYDGSFLLQTDASYRFIASALYNVHDDGTVKLCACYSARLNDRQTRMCILRKELLSIARALQRFRSQILGSRSFLQTDSKNLSRLLTSPNLSDELVRIAQSLSEYDLQIQFIPTKANILSD